MLRRCAARMRSSRSPCSLVAASVHLPGMPGGDRRSRRASAPWPPLAVARLSNICPACVRVMLRREDSGGIRRRSARAVSAAAIPVGGVPQHGARFLRVRSETLCRMRHSFLFSEHESNGREPDEGERVAVEVLPVLGQSAAAVEPGDGAFDHRRQRLLALDDEALHPIGSLGDLGLEIGQDAAPARLPLRGERRRPPDRRCRRTISRERCIRNRPALRKVAPQRETAVAILNVGGGDDAVQQQAWLAYRPERCRFLPLISLPASKPCAVDASPPRRSALFRVFLGDCACDAAPWGWLRVCGFLAALEVERMMDAIQRAVPVSQRQARACTGRSSDARCPSGNRQILGHKRAPLVYRPPAAGAQNRRCRPWTAPLITSRIAKTRRSHRPPPGLLRR